MNCKLSVFAIIVFGGIEDFWAECIGLSDSMAGSSVRCVWRNLKGQKAYSVLFVLPTYPTLLAAVEFDDTGSIRIGKYVFDHPFIIPGTHTITLSVIL